MRTALAGIGLGALVALLLALPAGASAAGITFVPPSGALSYPDHSEGPFGYDEALAFRTTDPRPTIGIKSSMSKLSHSSPLLHSETGSFSDCVPTRP